MKKIRISDAERAHAIAVQDDQAQYACHGAQGLQGEAGAAGKDGACADNVAPVIEANLESMFVYEAGKPYSLTMAANKAGLDYRFVAPSMRIEANGEEKGLDGK